MSQDKSVVEEPWSPISKEERILHEILFYSQGPVDGYILGEGIRDLLLKSGLSLTSLSQIWNLADISNDNVLTVHEFTVAMHLIRGVKSGRAIPKALPRTLVPPKTVTQMPPPMSQQEKDAYLRVFQTLDYNRTGFIEAAVAAEMFLATKLPPNILVQIWDLSEFSRDGKLSPEKFAIACHLLRYAKKGGSLDGPVDVFQYAPQHISPLSLLARKRRVSEYEEHKQRLMSLKETRKVQAVREARRFDLAKEKVGCLQELYELLAKLAPESEATNDINKILLKQKTDNEKQEEIALRLKKEHEKVRQETVKIILGEQKFNSDIAIIKKDSDELNKRLMFAYTHATKDPDPFHQLFEQRREKRQGSTIKDLDKIEIYIPFEFSPFDLSVTPDSLPSGGEVIARGSSPRQSVAEIKSVIADLKEFGDEFMNLWGGAASSSTETTKEFEDDEIFREVHDSGEDIWPNPELSENGLLASTNSQVTKIKQKLSEIRSEMAKLASEGGRLVFRNSEDYYARKKALEEEEKVQKGRVHIRSVTERIRTNSTGAYRSRDQVYSYAGERKISVDGSQAALVAREYRLKRRSLTFDSGHSSPEILRSIDRERRLYRSPTDPASVSDECSLSRESSLSSFDRPLSFRGSHILEEESATIRTHHSSRTDDSGIVTLTSERKGDFYLEPSASSSPVSYTNCDTPDASILPERAEEFEDNPGISETLEPTSLPPTFTELKLEEKYNHCDKSIDTERHNSTSPETTRRSSKKIRAPAPPCTSTPATAIHDKPAETGTRLSNNSDKLSDKLTEAKFLECFTNSNNDHLKYDASVNANLALNNKHKFAGEELEITENASLSRTESTPRRPPRLKKQVATSESSNGPLTPTSLSPAADVTTSFEETFVAGDSIQATGSCSLSPQQRSHNSELEVSSKKGPATDFQEHASARPADLQKHASPKLPDLDKDGFSYSSDVKRSVGHATTELARREVDSSQEQLSKEQAYPGIAPEATNFSSITGVDDSRKTTSKLPKMNVSIAQSQTQLTQSQVNTISSPTNILDGSHENFFSLNLNTYSTEDDNLTQSASAPPPLPSSAPPPLPTTTLPLHTDTFTHDDEEVVTIEYTTPRRPTFDEGNKDQSLSKTDDKFASMNSPSKTPDSPSTSNGELSKGSSENNKKLSETSKKSPSSKTITDLRSSFFGLKPRSSNVGLLENDLLETPTGKSLSSSVDGFKNEVSSKRFYHGNSEDFDVSDTSRGVSLNVVDSTFPPGDKTHANQRNEETTPAVNHTTKTSSISRRLPFTDSTDSSFKSSPSTSATLKSNQEPESTAHHSIPIQNTPQQERQPHSSISQSDKKASVQPTHTARISSSYSTRSESSEKVEESVSTSGSESGNKLKPATTVDGHKNVVTPKTRVVVKTESTFNGPLTDLEKERQEVIAQCMVTRKVNSALLSSSFEDGTISPEPVHSSGGKSFKSSNPSEYGFVYSAERPKPTPEVGWSDKQASEQKVNLYSENVLKDGDTTESVDRESIANLSTTKRQWESIFTSHSTSQVDTSTLKKKTSPKWEVRLPYREKHPLSPTHPSYLVKEDIDNPSKFEEDEDTRMFKKPVSTESAIEREIRLAHEREEMLRKEQEERQRLIQKQKSEAFVASSFATSSAESESTQPAYNELAEADRHPDLWRAEQNDGKQQQDEEESENESHIVKPNESIIEREIRLQREREAEIVRMRKQAQAKQLQPQTPQHHDFSQSEQQRTQHVELKDINHNATKTVSPESPTASNTNEVENRIVRELQELKEREEEIRRLHSGLQKTQLVDDIDGPIEPRSPVQSPTSGNIHVFSQPSAQVSWQRDGSHFVPPQRSESTYSSSSNHNLVRSPSDTIPTRYDVKVRPIADTYSDEEEEKPNYFLKQETPIAKEIRLARDRENELRKQKGLPEIDSKEDNQYGSYGADSVSNDTNSAARPRSFVQSGDSMKKFASTRLQQELQEQKDREIALLNEGKIITTSEQHIQPLNFMKVSASEQSEGTVKRNFVTKKVSVSNNEAFVPVEHHEEITSPSGQSARKTLAVGPGGQRFSYRESRQTAESKIEKELREMKEREEELRKQRAQALAGTTQ